MTTFQSSKQRKSGVSCSDICNGGLSSWISRKIYDQASECWTVSTSDYLPSGCRYVILFTREDTSTDSRKQRNGKGLWKSQKRRCSGCRANVKKTAGRFHHNRKSSARNISRRQFPSEDLSPESAQPVADAERWDWENEKKERQTEKKKTSRAPK